jgi:cupin fold WbuC family metalloprotein
MTHPLQAIMLASMKIFSESLLDALAAKATASPRKRANHNIHTQDSDPVQRFFVAADTDTYFRPHRHASKSELALVLRGRFDVVTFDEAGRVTGRHSIGGDSGDIAYEMPSGTYHTLIACTDGATFLEIKEGPYDRATAAEFAPWAPPEGDASVPQFLDWVRRAEPGSARGQSG